jgi:hypothetical protein
MNDLERYFTDNTGRLIHKWWHYFEIYERHLARYRGTHVVIVEFGVSQGGSLQMWKHYFGPDALIYGIDINPHCLRLAEPQIEIIIGDQSDRQFLSTLRTRIPHIDVLIDDGGHTMRQQLATFEELYPHVHANGLYICEDTHTSYWPSWGGGYRRSGTFTERIKQLIDSLHAWHSLDRKRFTVDMFTRSLHAVHVYDSVVVLEKRTVSRPYHQRTGTRTIPDYRPSVGIVQRLINAAHHGLRLLADRWRAMSGGAD